jgi:hypothetical protein
VLHNSYQFQKQDHQQQPRRWSTQCLEELDDQVLGPWSPRQQDAKDFDRGQEEHLKPRQEQKEYHSKQLDAIEN